MLILSYLLGLIALGFWLRRGSRDAVGYFLAGRGLPGWQVGLSMAATAFGSSALLTATEAVYRRGLAGLWFSLAPALGFGVLGLWFAGRIRASGAHSLADYVGRVHGPLARWCASLLLVVVELGFFALTVKGFALLTRPLLPPGVAGVFSDAALQAGICAVFVTYTLLGGQKSDVAADVIRLGIIGVGLVGVLLPAALARGGWPGLPPGHLALPFNPGTGSGALYALNMLVMMGLPSIIGGDVFAKILSARDGAAARRGFLLAGALRGGLSLCIAALALAACAQLPGLAAPAQAIPRLAEAILPPLLFQLVALALLSGLLSTGDSVLITTSTVLTLDILRLGEGVAVWKARLATLAVALGGLALALVFTGLLELIRFSYTLLTAGIAAPVLAGLVLRRRVAGGWFIAALAAGAGTALAWHLAGLDATTGLDAAPPGALVAALVITGGALRSGRQPA